jgi:hypothetical protein
VLNGLLLAIALVMRAVGGAVLVVAQGEWQGLWPSGTGCVMAHT